MFVLTSRDCADLIDVTPAQLSVLSDRAVSRSGCVIVSRHATNIHSYAPLWAGQPASSLKITQVYTALEISLRAAPTELRRSQPRTEC